MIYIFSSLNPWDM